MDSDTHQTFWVVQPLELMKHQPDSSVDVNDIYILYQTHISQKKKLVMLVQVEQ